MARLAELLEAAREQPCDLRRLAAAIVLPTTECLRTPDMRAYLRIVAAIVTDPAQSDPEVVELLHDPLHDEIGVTLATWRGLDPAVARERVHLLIAMVLHVCADRARLLDEQREIPARDVGRCAHDQPARHLHRLARGRRDPHLTTCCTTRPPAQLAAGQPRFFAIAVAADRYGIPVTEPVLTPGSTMSTKDARQLACSTDPARDFEDPLLTTAGHAREEARA